MKNVTNLKPAEELPTSSTDNIAKDVLESLQGLRELYAAMAVVGGAVALLPIPLPIVRQVAGSFALGGVLGWTVTGIAIDAGRFVQHLYE